jgi:hypothetical protein
MAMTTSNSISVKPDRAECARMGHLQGELRLGQPVYERGRPVAFMKG